MYFGCPYTTKCRQNLVSLEKSFEKPPKMLETAPTNTDDDGYPDLEWF